MKKFTKFAVLNILKGGIACLFVAGFFCAGTTNIYGVTPARNCNGTAALEVLSSGSVAPFFHAAKQTVFSEMLNTEKDCLDGEITPKSSTPHSAKTVSLVAHTRLKSHNLKLREKLSALETFISANGLKRLSGPTVPVGNLYLFSIEKAMTEFLQDELRGYCCADLRLQKKIAAAHELFPEARQALSNNKQLPDSTKSIPNPAK